MWNVMELWLEGKWIIEHSLILMNVIIMNYVIVELNDNNVSKWVLCEILAVWVQLIDLIELGELLWCN